MIHQPLPNGFAYWESVRKECKKRGCDGCSGPAMEFYQDACLEHDIHYQDAKWLNGDPITRQEADLVMRMRIQAWSAWGGASPMSWWRWAAVRLMGWHAWNKHRKRT